MKQSERLARIDALTKLCETYRTAREVGKLRPNEVKKYHDALAELERVRRQERGFQSIFEFGRIYFSSEPPHDLINPDTPSPKFHHELTEMLRETAMKREMDKVAVTAPRSHAKSVWCSNIFLVWVVCYKDDIPSSPYWVLVGDDVDSARKQLDVIKLALSGNEKVKEDFGALVGPVWNAYEIITANGVKLEAAGIAQGIRGTRFGSYRPNVVFDDVETDESCATPERIAKTISKFDRTFLPLGDPKRSKFVLVGTIINYGSLLNQVMRLRGDWRKIKYRAVISFPERMDLWQKWTEIYHSRSDADTPEEATQIAYRKAREFYEANRAEMDQGAKVLWPERIDLYQLMVLRETNRLAFLSEQQNEPLDEDTRLFKLLHYFNADEVDLDQLDYYYACDPSMGKSKRSDFSAIITVGKHRKTGIIYVIDADIKRRSPDEIILTLFKKAQQYRYKDGLIEGVAFQEFFRQEVIKRSAELNLYLPAREFKTDNTMKDVRIAAIEPMLTNGYVRLMPTMTEMIEQLTYFPKHNKRDGPDALAMVLDLVRNKTGAVVMGLL